MTYTLHHGDCLEVLATLPDCSVDAIVTDPPAGIAFMGKAWDRDKGGKTEWVQWMQSVAAQCLRVIKPGGHALVWAIPRTSHWTGDAWEEAGWQVRDKIYHVFGSGFPKSMDVSKAIDKAAGAEREVVGKQSRSQVCSEGWDRPWKQQAMQASGSTVAEFDLTAPATPEAKQWAGWGTALKPAAEEWWLFRRPLEGTVAANVLKHGTGAINIDATRIKTEDQEHDADAYRRLSSLGSSVCSGDVPPEQILGSLRHIVFGLRSCSIGDSDRWHNAPGLDGSLLDHALCGHLVTHLFPSGAWCGGSSWSVPDSLCGCQPCRRFCDEHTRLLRESAQCGIPSLADALERICLGRFEYEHSRECRCSDRPSNSGDFLLAWSLSFVIGECCTLYSSAPNKARWPANFTHDGSDEATALLGDAARFFYSPKASQDDRNSGDVPNTHATVKSQDLMTYLCRLITPPGGTILDPFTGSGSTGKAAILEGFKFIGIEREAEYIEIARARIDAAIKFRSEFLF